MMDDTTGQPFSYLSVTPDDLTPSTFEPAWGARTDRNKLP